MPVKLSNGKEGELLVGDMSTFLGYELETRYQSYGLTRLDIWTMSLPLAVCLMTRDTIGLVIWLIERVFTFYWMAVEPLTVSYLISSSKPCSPTHCSCRPVVKTAGGRVPVIQLEEVIRRLGYLKEAYVVPVKDRTIGVRLGVLAKPRTGVVSLKSLRVDLAPHVPKFMLPNAFQLMAEEEQVPWTPSDKVAKKKLIDEFFPYTEEKGLPHTVELADLSCIDL